MEFQVLKLETIDALDFCGKQVPVLFDLLTLKPDLVAFELKRAAKFVQLRAETLDLNVLTHLQLLAQNGHISQLSSESFEKGIVLELRKVRLWWCLRNELATFFLRAILMWQIAIR